MARNRCGAILAAVLALGAVLTGAGCDNNHGAGQAATDVVHVRAWNGTSLDSGLKQTAKATGSCWVPSNVTGRKDAYRCMAGNKIYDPCFAAPAGAGAGRVACPLNATDVAVLTLTDPLPEPDLHAVAQVWMVVLSNGVRCSRGSGAGPAPRDGLYADLITTLPAGPEHPGRTTGPSFELFYETDYLIPHRDAAWTMLDERLRAAEQFAERIRADADAGVAEALAPIGPALLTMADTLAAHALAPPGSRTDTTEDRADEPIALPAENEPVRFDQHIKPLFRARDRQSMSFAFDLWDHDAVRTNAKAILDRLRDGSMPCDGAWPAERIDVFARWVAAGSPR